MAGISLVMGITGIVTSFLAIGMVPSLIGLILGIVSKKNTGKGKAGIVTSIVGIILSAACLIIFSRVIKQNGGGVSDLLSKQGIKEAAGVIIDEYNTPPEEMGIPEDTEFNPHRADSVLLSNQNFDFITPDPEITRMGGTHDEPFFKCIIFTKAPLPEYIYSYYDKHFLTADERHAVINTADNTVSEIYCDGEYLVVSVREYTPGTENSAESLLSGEHLQTYRVYIDNTDITVE